MPFRDFTRKPLGLSKSKKMTSQRPPSSQLPNKSRSKTPLNALDNNSPLWQRFYNKDVRNKNPNMSDEEVKHYADVRVQWRKADRENKRTRQNATRRPPPLPQPYIASARGDNTPLFALDTNSPLWRQIYANKVRNAHPHMSEEEQQQQVDRLVRRRRSVKDKKRGTKLGGKKKSRRKSRKLLSFLN
jgi:hypothetical protein